MAKIKYIKAWGLWSHFNTSMELAPGLTVIVGPNGSGKTTAVRILQWVFLGIPTGEDFLFKQEDEKTHEVIREVTEGGAEIGLDNGVVITKTRRKGKTTYTHSLIKEPFEKAEVPQEIIDALGIKEYVYGDFKTHLNFAFQLEAPFLLSESPSVGAKVLGKIAGTEVIDLSISDVAKRTHKARTEKTAADKEAERLTGNLLEYQGLEDIRTAVELCEKLVNTVDSDYQRKELLFSLSHSLEVAQNHIDEYVDKLSKYKHVEDIRATLEDTEKDQQRYVSLAGYVDQLQSVRDSIETKTSQLALYEGLDAAAIILRDLEKLEQRLVNILMLSTVYTKYAQEVNKYTELTTLLTNVDNVGDLLKQVDQDNRKLEGIKKLDTDYIKADSEIKTHRKTLETLENVGGIKTLLTTLDADSDRLGGIAALKFMYEAADKVARTLHNKLLTFSNLQRAGEQLSSIETELKRLELWKTLDNEFHEKNSAEYQRRHEAATAVEDVDKAQQELSEAWDAAGGICPLCDEPISTHKH